MRRSLGIGCVVVGIGILLAPVLRAKDVVGVYGLPDKVVLEPNDTAPERAQVWGAFLMADRKTPTEYLPVERGYLYYTCPPDKTSTCAKEWSDLKALAGKGQAVGFGSRFQANGRVRKGTDAVESPDPYPIQFGLVRLGTDDHAADILARLKSAQ